MKAVILAGGRGTRISEESTMRPKPMIELGGKPILWHIMKLYSVGGINDFVICLGYKGYMIKEYFANYFLHTSNVTIDVKQNKMEVHEKYAEPWRVTLVDTGVATNTGGRIRRVAPYVGDEDFCLTYGDGLSDVNIPELLDFHRAHGRSATMTAVQPEGRFGSVGVEGEEGRVTAFHEKPRGDGRWINAGFFVLSPKVVDHIEGDDTSWEHSPLEELANEGELRAFKHDGFWHAMDTMRDKAHLEELWSSGQAPWKTWS
ncbi:MAG: glucose-1-phosphate cytidylyltransferase [Deltaproteobacteria bacterium]|nr:glucose-1-phosphate cytidylyltransferase [Deltaproteobacteria bacterium]MBW2380802.1 glucose-1-phosphate cytidylyltransferase [Deltaproteobacteria bacterium]MBW2688253.1 glucose-1-phosphate cytidylyltransferase [Deltaproteobacteria bacterium]